MGNLLGKYLLENIWQTQVTSLYRYEEPWRQPSVWDDKLEKSLIIEIMKQQSDSFQNVLILGSTEEGISTFINSTTQIFQRIKHSTSKDDEDNAPLLQRLSSAEHLHGDTVFYLSGDTCIGEEINIVGSKLFIKSYSEKEYLFNPVATNRNYLHGFGHRLHGFGHRQRTERQIHCVTFVVCAWDIIAGVREYKEIKQLHQQLRQKRIPVVLVLTMVDQICEEVSLDITKMFRSKKVQGVIETASQMFGIEQFSIHPVVSHYYFGRPTEYNILLLLALKQLMTYVTNYLQMHVADGHDHGSGTIQLHCSKVEKMLDENILPTNEDIQTINNLCGRQSEKMKTLCGKICGVINRKMYKETATDIWPAWDPKTDKIVFVVEPTQIAGVSSTSFHTDLKLIEYKRKCSTFEREGRVVMAKERALLTNQKYDYVIHLQSFQKKISTYSKELMDKHKNITAIFPSIVKSVGYLESGKHRLIETLCISIRVEKKVSGLIPLAEEPIAPYIGQFPTDVIAGDFCLLGKGPNAFHENVKIGSAIHAGLVTDKGELLGGTLGCFVNHEKFGLCCLTSAHIILSQAEIQEVQKDGYREYAKNRLKPVYQPISKRLLQFGQVVAAACIEGQHDMPGIEVALIKILCRPPISGSFPLTDSKTSHTFTFSSGNVANAKLLRPLTEVFKFGIQTGLTFGLLGIPGVSVRYRGDLRLENQLVIMPKEDAPFAEIGDSGSSAFIGLSCPGTEAVIGLVSGGFDSGQVLVTPIHAALKAVQCPPYLHRFEDADSGFNDNISKGSAEMRQFATQMSMEKKLTTESISSEYSPAFARVEKLVNEKNLPKNDDLQSIYKAHGRKYEPLKEICEKICNIMKKKIYNDAVKNVWPARNLANENVVFVVESAREAAVHPTFQHDLEIIIDHGDSTGKKESIEIMTKERNILKNETDEYRKKIKQLQPILIKHSKQLMDKHKHITAILPCVVKSVGYGKSDKHLLLEELCVSIHVKRKVSGFIPLDEDPISMMLEDIPTDVVQGECRLFFNGPNDYHGNLKMGLAIHARASNDNGDILGGTLGCFVQHQRYGMCCITNAHIVLQQSELRDLFRFCHIEYGTNNGKPVFQPLRFNTDPFGIVVAAAGYGGNAFKSGLEVALIKIVDRQPLSGSFPQSTSESAPTFTFNTGNVTDVNLLQLGVEVFKFGMETGPTIGLLHSHGALANYNEGIQLHQQIVVIPAKDETFAAQGDSGSSVFIGFTRPGRESVIGLISGGLDNGSVFVTPIYEILESVSCQPYLHRF